MAGQNPTDSHQAFLDVNSPVTVCVHADNNAATDIRGQSASTRGRSPVVSLPDSLCR